MRTVIFDLDGTLADTSGDLIAAANACFRARGFENQLDPVVDATTAFHGGRAMLRLGFERLGISDVREVDTEYPNLLAYYSENIDTFTRLYPGVLAALDRLEGRGYRLGICTNKPVDLAETLLKRLQVHHRFGTLVGAGTLEVRKPDPAPLLLSIENLGGDVRQSVLIGDTVTDRDAAKNAGIPCVLVKFGPEGAGVSALEPAALLDHYDALDVVVQQLIG